MDRRTNRRTDRPSYRDARTHLKTNLVLLSTRIWFPDAANPIFFALMEFNGEMLYKRQSLVDSRGGCLSRCFVIHQTTTTTSRLSVPLHIRPSIALNEITLSYIIDVNDRAHRSDSHQLCLLLSYWIIHRLSGVGELDFLGDKMQEYLTHQNLESEYELAIIDNSLA